MKIEVATKKYFEEKKFIEENFDFPENIQELIDQIGRASCRERV